MFLARSVSPLIQSVWHSVSILQVLFGVWTLGDSLRFWAWNVDALGVYVFMAGLILLIRPILYRIWFYHSVPDFREDRLFVFGGWTGALRNHAEGLTERM
jgi:membrane protein YdbS with pleckstrin-like domain